MRLGLRGFEVLRIDGEEVVRGYERDCGWRLRAGIGMGDERRIF